MSKFTAGPKDVAEARSDLEREWREHNEQIDIDQSFCDAVGAHLPSYRVRYDDFADYLIYRMLQEELDRALDDAGEDA